MNPQTCDPDRLTAFVRGGLSETDEDALARHLDQCRLCGERLESELAETATWREAQEFLTRDPVCDAGWSGGETPPRRDLQIDQVLQQLAPTDDPTSLGRIGGYEVIGAVGSGGMGVVLKARDRSLDRIVAVKVMAPHLATSGSARQRFAREARAAAAVLHPNVIAIHSVSNDQTLPYLVMPYIPGTSLQMRIDAEGWLPVIDILRIGEQVAAGLAAAHEQGLVHRDIKPANILLEQGVERITITDFGLARAGDDASMTRSGLIAGTPQYMSPEQARGEIIDSRSDLFSLGSLLYAMCTGHSPFRAETSYGVLHRITHDSPRSIREQNPDIPSWLECIVMKLLDRSPDARFDSAAEVAALLQQGLAHIQHPQTVPLPDSVARLVPRPARGSSWRKLTATGTAALLLAFAGFLILLELNKGTLRIESEADDVSIRISQDDEVVETLTVSRAGAAVRVAAGQYRIEIGGDVDGIAIEEGVVSVSRRGTKVVHIRQLAGDDDTTIESTSPLPTSDTQISDVQTPDAQKVTADLAQIMVALHRYHAEHGHFPPAVIHGRNGEEGPPHSWRVELLPLLGEQDLYEQYRFDEHWDSPHNRALLPRMPDVFRSPRDDSSSVNTSYFGVTSAPTGRTLLGSEQGVSLHEISDGTSGTIAIVEANRRIPWTRPEDIASIGDGLPDGIGGWFHNGWYAAFADGAVKQLACELSGPNLNALFSIADGNNAEPVLARRLEIRMATKMTEDDSAGGWNWETPAGTWLHIPSDVPPIISEQDVVDVQAVAESGRSQGRDSIAMRLTSAASERFLAATTQMTSQPDPGYLAIVFDGEVLCAPRVLSPISSQLRISGLGDSNEVAALVARIQAAMHTSREAEGEPEPPAGSPVPDTDGGETSASGAAGADQRRP